MSEQWKRQEDAASKGRHVLHEKMEAISIQVTRLAGIAESVQQDVAEMKNDIDDNVTPTIIAYKLDKAARGGAIGMGKWIWGVILALCTAIGFAIHEAILYFNHGTSGAVPHIPGIH